MGKKVILVRNLPSRTEDYMFSKRRFIKFYIFVRGIALVSFYLSRTEMHLLDRNRSIFADRSIIHAIVHCTHGTNNNIMR